MCAESDCDYLAGRFGYVQVITYLVAFGKLDWFAHRNLRPHVGDEPPWIFTLAKKVEESTPSKGD
jgi:hypothetical protein